MTESGVKSYKRAKLVQSFDTIVIGSGIGGLATAAILAKMGGQRVLVLERHTTVGGFTHTFTRPGYEWDVGVHYVGELNEGEKHRQFFDWLTDGRLEWAPLPDVYDRIYIGDRSYDFPTGEERFRAAMKSYFPAEAKVIDRYVTMVTRAQRWVEPFYASQALPPLLSKVVGPLLRAPLRRSTDRTVAEVFSELGASPELSAVLAGQWGDYGLPPKRASFGIHALVAGHYFGGAHFPVGGSSSIAASIIPTIEKAGGEIFIGAKVERILIEGGAAVGVRMADGREIRAKRVVSAAGLGATLGDLMDPETAAATGYMHCVRVANASTAHVALYLGLKNTDEELGLTGTNRWIYGDSDHDEAVARFERDPNARLPLVYVSFPSAKDPSWASRYPGRATIDVITLVPWKGWERFEGTKWQKRGTEYSEIKDVMAERMLELVLPTLPQIRGKIDWQEVSTPVTTNHFTGARDGRIFGLEHTPARMRQSIGPGTGVPGLFLSGQDVVCAGVGGSVVSGMLTATAMLGRNVFGAMAKGTRWKN